MGILNRTPDSFYDGGKYWEMDDFLAQVEKLVKDGADVLDVGGVKAAPGEEVSLAEELERICPSVQEITKHFDTPISVDTWRAEVLEESIKQGAVLGNDISGFADPEYLRTASEGGAAVVACHMRLAPRYADPDPKYGDLLSDIRSFLAERCRWAREAAIPADKVLIDVGLDFGKTYEMSAKIFWQMDYFKNLGHPMVLAASHKEFLGHLSGLARPERGGVSLAACALAIERGCRLVRVHDVKQSVAVAEMMAEALSQ